MYKNLTKSIYIFILWLNQILETRLRYNRLFRQACYVKELGSRARNLSSSHRYMNEASPLLDPESLGMVMILECLLSAIHAL